MSFLKGVSLKSRIEPDFVFLIKSNNLCLLIMEFKAFRITGITEIFGLDSII